MTKADVDAGYELSTQAGWNQTRDDWERILALAPEGCMCVEQDGRVVATTTLMEYGQDLGWIGMVLTHRDYQRRGLARELVSGAIGLADDEGIRCLKLDATDYGYPLYKALGFVDEQPIERWRREPAPLDGDRIPEGTGVDRADARAFGADRGSLLVALMPSLSLDGGYVVRRPGRVARYLGPCVAEEHTVANTLIRACIAEHPDEPWFWDVLPEGNPNAVRLATELGFAPVRRLVRMSRGEPVRGDDKLVYATAGFEFG